MGNQEEEAYLKEHACHLGSLLANFQSLEFAIRAYLLQQPGASAIGIPVGRNLYEVEVGECLPESPLTSFDSLSVLIAKYNTIARTRGDPGIDSSIAETRDAIAHGRVSALSTDDTLSLLKFSKPKNGTVTVTFNERLSNEWFTAQKKRVYEAVVAVAANLTPAAYL